MYYHTRQILAVCLCCKLQHLHRTRWVAVKAVFISKLNWLLPGLRQKRLHCAGSRSLAQDLPELEAATENSKFSELKPRRSSKPGWKLLSASFGRQLSESRPPSCSHAEPREPWDPGPNAGRSPTTWAQCTLGSEGPLQMAKHASALFGKVNKRRSANRTPVRKRTMEEQVSRGRAAMLCFCPSQL